MYGYTEPDNFNITLFQHYLVVTFVHFAHCTEGPIRASSFILNTPADLIKWVHKKNKPKMLGYVELPCNHTVNCRPCVLIITRLLWQLSVGTFNITRFRVHCAHSVATLFDSKTPLVLSLLCTFVLNAFPYYNYILNIKLILNTELILINVIEQPLESEMVGISSRHIKWIVFLC